MKFHITAILAAVLTVTAISGCKTTEENYRKAYETARNANTEDLDSTIYARIRQEAVPTAVMANGDTIRMQTEFVTLFKDDRSPVTARPYGVVVNQFKQIFNAKALRNRLHTSGYSGAYIVHTREPLYYVVIADFDDVEQASAMMKRVAGNSELNIRSPFPWILKNPYRH